MPRKKIFERKTWFKFLTVLMSLIIGSVAFEIFLRAINYHPMLVDPNIYLANNNPLLPYKLKPNYDDYYLQQEVKIDGDGNRMVSPDPKLLPAERKETAARVILILGDSLVFGYGLSNEDTIASQLQNLLWKKGLNYEVRNIGAPGYTSWNEYVALDDYLKTHAISDVILAYVPNDITFDNDYFQIGQGKLASFSDTRFHRFTQFLYSHFYTLYVVSDALKKIYSRLRGEIEPSAATAFAERNNQPAIDYSMEALSRIRDLCKQKHVRFSVGIYRAAALYDKLPDISSEYEAVIKKNLDQRGIRSFLIKSHADNLKPADAQVFWNDPHPSRQAVGFIVADINSVIE